ESVRHIGRASRHGYAIRDAPRDAIGDRGTERYDRITRIGWQVVLLADVNPDFLTRGLDRSVEGCDDVRAEVRERCERWIEVDELERDEAVPVDAQRRYPVRAN